MLKPYGVELEIIEKLKRLALESKVTKVTTMNSNNFRNAMRDSKQNFAKNI